MGKIDNVVGYLVDSPSDLSPDLKVQLSTALPALPLQDASILALGWRAALSCASKLEQSDRRNNDSEKN